MIHCTNLRKEYDSTVALDDLTLTIPPGSVFGLLGPNGSGKSTLIKLLMGFIFPTAGSIDLQGMRVSEIGYLPERVLFPMSVRLAEYLNLTARLVNLPERIVRQAVADRLQQVGLSHAAQWRIATCSKGMLQRLALAASLIGNPPLLVLDEPMSGLDPQAQFQMRNLIRQAHQAGATILLSSHQLSDVSELCTHIAILKQSRLMRVGTLDQLLAWRDQVTLQLHSLDATSAETLRTHYPTLAISGATLQLRDELVAHKNELIALLLQLGLDIVELKQERSNLEELYLEATR